MHRFCTRKMATIVKQKSGRWRAQVRRKGRSLSETFSLRKDAEAWARRVERDLDVGRRPMPRRLEGIQTFGDLIDLHVADMKNVNRAPGRSKAFSMDLLKDRLGRVRLSNLDREELIAFGRARAREGAGPVTLGIDLGYIRTVLTHAAAVHGLEVSPEPLDLARVALKILGLVGKGVERDRRPSEAEIDALLERFRSQNSSDIPMGRIVRFAIASAMRQEEICRIEWDDVNPRIKTVTIRDRKDPRNKRGNNQQVPLLGVSGYDAWQLLKEQAQHLGHRRGRIFPYNCRSVGTAYRVAVNSNDHPPPHVHAFGKGCEARFSSTAQRDQWSSGTMSVIGPWRG